jgi:hypothetical protein
MHLSFPAKLCLCLCLLSAAFSSPSYGDDDASKRLIQAYVDAVKTDDPVLIKSAWIALGNDQDALDFMDIHTPQLAYLYRIRGLYMQIQEIQSSRPEFFGKAAPYESAGSLETLRSDLAPGAVEEVAKFSVSEADRTRFRTNRDIVMSTKGRQLPDNRSIAISNPNQNRQPNDEYVQNRLDSMFGQKFQESPGQLVPRGNSFPKARPSTVADVRIQGNSTLAFIQKTSPAESVVDVALNGRSISRGLRLRDALETLDLFLEPGMNSLKISHPPGVDAGAVSLAVSFEARFGGKKQIPLALQPGQSFIIYVEAAP